MKLLLLGVTLVLATSVVSGVTTAAAALERRISPAPPLFSSVPAGGFPDRFPFGQCTWWVAFNRPVTWGGNAADWLANAAAQGVPTTDRPTIGAIAVYRPGGAYSPFGHVAVVTAVTSGSYRVSEMNAVGWGQVSVREIPWPDPELQGFIAPLPANPP